MNTFTNSLETLASLLTNTYAGIDTILDRIVENPSSQVEKGISDAIKGLSAQSMILNI